MKSIDRQGNCFFVHTGEEVVEATTLLFATETRHRELAVPGHDEFGNKGVQYCALCDGPLYKKKVVAVVGGSASAAKEALLLAEYASRVYLIARGPGIKPERINRLRVEQNSRIRVITRANVVRIEGVKHVERVILDRPLEDKKEELAFDAVFIAIGVIPLAELAVPLGVAGSGAAGGWDDDGPRAGDLAPGTRPVAQRCGANVVRGANSGGAGGPHRARRRARGAPGAASNGGRFNSAGEIQ